MYDFKSLDYVKDSYGARIGQLTESKRAGKKIVGTFCLFVPDEIIFAAGADRVILCGGKNDTISIAEQYLPRNVCPLVKSSFGSIANSDCSVSTRGVTSCPHFNLVDMIVAEATCDGKKKMYELLDEYVPTHVIDLPQKPDSPEAIQYYLSELDKFKVTMERLTGNKVTDEKLRAEIKSSNDTRRMFHRLYDLRTMDPPPIRGADVLKILQKQYFLSPGELKKSLHRFIDEAEQVKTDGGHKPRIMISGCPMPGGNVKVPDIIESRGGVIVVEESCTGTRSFWEPVDERKDPMIALAERYIKIPCSCMTPNDRRIDNILELAKKFDVEGVVYYTLQSCHTYNVEKYKVQQALKKAKIPMLAIETDYGESDVEQIGIRVDAFLEMLS
jgi:benzoyl-CoA reductase/2-hydroxyglutaryl-CoA dehydratase subunit BcrC/BadD/HgdB